MAILLLSPCLSLSSALCLPLPVLSSAFRFETVGKTSQSLELRASILHFRYFLPSPHLAPSAPPLDGRTFLPTCMDRGWIRQVMGELRVTFPGFCVQCGLGSLETSLVDVVERELFRHGFGSWERLIGYGMQISSGSGCPFGH